MSETNVQAAAVVEQRAKRSKVDTFLLWAVLFGLLTLICLVLYGMTSGLFARTAPQTLNEAIMTSSKAAVKEDPKSGIAWAQYLRAIYLTGDKDAAWDQLAKARKSVKGDSVVWLNATEVDMLIRDGKNAEAVKKSTDYIAQDIKIREKAKIAELQKNVNTPVDAMDNSATIRMFILRATAEGNLKKYDDAVISLTNALKLDGKAADVIAMRGWAKLNAKDLKGAKEDFERAKIFLADDPSIDQGLKAVKEAEAKSK